MNLSVNNLGKPSDKKWKKIADYLLYTGLPAIVAFFVAIQPVNLTFSLYGIAITTLLITLFKGATKFTVDDEHKDS
jgi:hypothetical protein